MAAEVAAKVTAEVAAEVAAEVVGQGGGRGCWPGLLARVEAKVVGHGGGVAQVAAGVAGGRSSSPSLRSGSGGTPYQTAQERNFKIQF